MQKPRLLIVEDSFSLSSMLCFQLKRNYHVSQAPTLQAAFALCGENIYDLVLLDRTLPDGDGTELIDFLNHHFPHTRICIMSSRTELEERLHGLNRGADHYLSKPFEPQEVSALLRTLLRRGQLLQPHVLQANAVELRLDTRLLCRENTQVRLTPREAQLMELFLRSSTSVLTLEQIRHWFWIHGLETKNTHIHVYSQRLRKKLKQIRGTIVAHYGTGYELKILE